MANPKQVITSLLTEHFRYTPLTLLDDIINTVNELVYRAVTAVEEGLTGAPAASLGFAERAAAEDRVVEKDDDDSVIYPESRAEIEHGVHQLETLLESTVDKNFDKLEIFVLRTILSVPEDLAPWMRLPHYEDLDFVNRPDAPTPQFLHLLRRKLHETRKLQTALVAERSRNAVLISQLKSLLQSPTNPLAPQEASLAFLTANTPARNVGISSADGSAKHPLTTDTQFVVSHLPVLRQILDELRPKMGTLVAPRPGTAAEERRDYIETQTRRRLEKGGVNIETGEGLMGSDTLGSRIGAEEVDGIEAVAGMLEQETHGEAMEER